MLKTELYGATKGVEGAIGFAYDPCTKIYGELHDIIAVHKIFRAVGDFAVWDFAKSLAQTIAKLCLVLCHLGRGFCALVG